MAYVQNLDEDKDNQQQVNNAGATSVQTGAGQGVAIGGTDSTPAGQKASSGRFTNIQKYLGANQNAGQQIAGNVSNQLDKNVQQQLTGAQDTQKAIQNGVTDANSALQRGAGYQTELGGDNPFKLANSSFAAKPVEAQSLNPNDAKVDQTGTVFDSNMGGKFQSFANDTNKLTDLTKFRYGQNINENQLAQQGTNAQTAAGTFQNQAQNEADRTKDENGRFGLVKQTFGRPNYSAGQQRLDNVFFGTSGNAGIGQVQNTANQNINKAQQFGQQAQDYSGQISNIAGQDKNLQNQLNTTTSGLKSSFMDMLNERIDPTKTAYGNEVDRYGQNIGLLTRTPSDTRTDKAIDQDIWNETGLQGGEQLFNSLAGKRLDELAQVNDLRKRSLTAQDVSKQGDVDTLKALNSLSQSNIDENGNVAKNYTDEFNTAGNLGRAVTLNQDGTGVLGRINTATKNFLDSAAGTNITATGQDRYSGNGWFGGGGGLETRTATANIADLLNKSGYSGLAMGGTPGKEGVPRHVISQIGNIVSLGDTLGNAYSGLVDNVFGDSGQSGARRAASIRAQQNLQGALSQYFKDQGFNSAATRNGAVDISNPLNTKREDKMEQDDVIRNSIGMENGLEGVDLRSTPEEIRAAAVAAQNKIGYAPEDDPGKEAIERYIQDRINNTNGILAKGRAQVTRLGNEQNTQQALIDKLLGTTNSNLNPTQTVRTQVERG